MRNSFATCMLVVHLVFYAGAGAIAGDAAWRIAKSSGDVSVITSGTQQAALTDGAMLKPGDSIRTGQTGRVLLMRGEESIIISPNSVISIPKGQIDGMSTTIIQQAGSILLEVEKRNVKHFEVQTPYLAAVVKGTKFSVTVNKYDSNVDVVRGQVEVMDLKSGQYAIVLPGQAASVSAQGQPGLSLSGSGTLSPIQQGTPRQSSAPPLTVAAEDLIAPDAATGGPKVSEALALRKRVSVPVLSGGSANDASMWNSGFGLSDADEGNRKSWWGGSDNVTFDLAFPFGVGCVVAVGVAAQRRRQKQKKTQPPRLI